VELFREARPKTHRAGRLKTDEVQSDSEQSNYGVNKCNGDLSPIETIVYRLAALISFLFADHSPRITKLASWRSEEHPFPGAIPVESASQMLSFSNQEYRACTRKPRFTRHPGETNGSCARRFSLCVSP
jgi:hypothetical protein